MGLGSQDQTGAGDPAAPAGWYPVDSGLQRYWDGHQWTEHTAPAPSPTPPPQTSSGRIPLANDPLAQPPTVQSPIGADAPTPWVDGSPAGQPPLDQPPLDQPLGPQPDAQVQPFSVSPQGSAPVDRPAAVPTGLVSADDRSMALLLHLLTLVVGFLGPLIVWLTKRDQSPFIDYHGKEALNFQFSMFLYWICSLLAMIILIGFLLIPVLLVLQILFPILAGVAANRGEYYRYPLTIRFIS